MPDSLSSSLDHVSDPNHLSQLLRLAATCLSLDAFLHDPLFRIPEPSV